MFWHRAPSYGTSSKYINWTVHRTFPTVVSYLLLKIAWGEANAICMCICVQSVMKQSEGAGSGGIMLQSTRRRDSTAEMRQSNIAAPDTSHMQPFRPSTISGRLTCMSIVEAKWPGAVSKDWFEYIWCCKTKITTQVYSYTGNNQYVQLHINSSIQSYMDHPSETYIHYKNMFMISLYMYVCLF